MNSSHQQAKGATWPSLIKHIFDKLREEDLKGFLLVRIAIITVIFGIGGGFLEKVLSAEKLDKGYFIGIALLVSLGMSLFISVRLDTKLTKKQKKYWASVSLILLVLGLLLSFFFKNSYDHSTFLIHEDYPDSTGNYESPAKLYLKGQYYSLKAKQIRNEYKSANGVYPEDKDLLMNFGNIDGYSKVWDESSLRWSQNILFFLYVLTVTCFVTTITLLSEINFRKTKTERKENPERRRKETQTAVSGPGKPLQSST